MAIGQGKLVGELQLGLSTLKKNINDANKILQTIDMSKINVDIITTKQATTAINTLKLIKKELDSMGNTNITTTKIDDFVKNLTAALMKVSSEITKTTTKTITDTANAIDKTVKMVESVNAAGKKLTTNNTTNNKTGNTVTTTANTTDYKQQAKDLDALANSINRQSEAQKKNAGQNTTLYNAGYKSQLDGINQSYLTLNSSEKARISDLNALASKSTALISSLGLEGTARMQATSQAKKYTDEAKRVQLAIDQEVKSRQDVTAKIIAANEKQALSALKLYTQEKASSQEYDKMSKELSKISGESQLAMGSGNINNSLMDRAKISGAYAFAAANIYLLTSSIKELITTNSSYEVSLNNLSRTLENVTNNDLKEYGKQAVAYSKDFGQPLQEVQTAMTELARAGISSKSDLTGMSKSVMLGLNTTEIASATEMTGYLVSAVKQLGMSFQDSEKIIDGWNKLGDKYAVKSNDMAEAMQRAGSSSKNLGIDLNNLNAITVVIGEATQKSGSEIGNAIKTMETRLLRPETISVLESYGITVMKDAEHFNTFKDIMTSTNIALDKFGEGTKSSNDILDAMGGVTLKLPIFVKSIDR